MLIKNEEPIKEPVTEPIAGPIERGDGIGIPGMKAESPVVLKAEREVAEAISVASDFGEARITKIVIRYASIFPASGIAARYNDQRDANLQWKPMTEERRAVFQKALDTIAEMIEENLKA